MPLNCRLSQAFFEKQDQDYSLFFYDVLLSCLLFMEIGHVRGKRGSTRCSTDIDILQIMSYFGSKEMQSKLLSKNILIFSNHITNVRFIQVARYYLHAYFPLAYISLVMYLNCRCLFISLHFWHCCHTSRSCVASSHVYMHIAEMTVKFTLTFDVAGAKSTKPLEQVTVAYK